LIRDIVSALGFPPKGPIGVRAGCRAAHEPCPGADRSAGSGVPGGRPDCRAESRPDERSHSGADRGVLVYGRPGWGADLLRRPLPTDAILALEFLEGLSGRG
jgi:hypothetical protein